MLSDREKEVVRLIATKGYSNKEIANDLNITVATVKCHVKAIFRALGINNRSKLIIYANKAGVV